LDGIHDEEEELEDEDALLDEEDYVKPSLGGEFFHI